MNQRRSLFSCPLQRQTVARIVYFQTIGGIGDDDVSEVLLQVECSKERFCPDQHRCPMQR